MAPGGGDAADRRLPGWPAANDTDPYNGPGIFLPPERPEPSPAALDAVSRRCLRHWTVTEAAAAVTVAGDIDLPAVCAALDVAGRGRPVAAWEPGAGLGWRRAIDAWADAALAVHRPRARIARRAARRWAGRTDPAAVLAATGVDLVGERDRIELSWRLGAAAAGDPAGDDWADWLTRRLDRWADKSAATAHRLALIAVDADLRGLPDLRPALPDHWTTGALT